MKKIFFFLFFAVVFSCSPSPTDSISVENMKRIVKILSSDDFKGRKPFTDGEVKTVHFLAEELKKLGFEPLFDSSYFQKVPMIQTTSKVEGPAIFMLPGKRIELSAPDQIAINSPLLDEIIDLKNSEIVFCGFGIASKEDDWNDYKGVDVKGKTVIVLINDPGLYTGDSTLFKGSEMTYYGRWTYKYEEAARQGADAVLIIHDVKGAGYGYNVPRNSSITSRLSIDDPKRKRACKVTGWISGESADSLFNQMGYSLKQLIEKACSKDFQAISLNAKFSARILNEVKRDASINVGGILKGSQKPEEAILITAHWDHFGIGETQEGDSIYNGAVDNCTTIAWAMEIGKCFTELKKPQSRSVILLFPTAEEQGLVGSEFYAEHPVVPLKSTIACLNNDMMVPRGKMKDVTIIGYGYSTLDSIYKIEAQKQDRYIMPDPNSHTGLFFRSDHFPFFKRGVPSIWAMGCFDSRDKGKEWANETWNKYISKIYHRPSDNYNPTWDWDGIVEDTKLAFNVSLILCNDLNIKIRIK